MEEVEKELNASLEKPTCSGDYTWTGTYRDCKYISDYWYDISWKDGFEDESCAADDNYDFLSCKCLNHEELNCIYCTIKNSITGNNLNFPSYVNYTIPDGYQLISMDLGVDYCVCGATNEEDYLTQFVINYKIGIPNCQKNIIDPPVFGGVDPLTVDLTGFK